MLVSANGFVDVVDERHVALDPSRVAAHVVSGLGFIGGRIIFLRQDAARGLTTAARRGSLRPSGWGATAIRHWLPSPRP